MGERGHYEDPWNAGQETVRPRHPLLSSLTVEVWSWHSKPLRDSGQRKTAPEPWTQRVPAEENALFNPGASGARTQETLCLLLVDLLGGSLPLCPSLTPSDHLPAYPRPLLPVSPLLPFTPSAPGLPGLPDGPGQQIPWRV